VTSELVFVNKCKSYGNPEYCKHAAVAFLKKLKKELKAELNINVKIYYINFQNYFVFMK
jgi:hypothetical protein